jgi:hypothetical protein
MIFSRIDIISPKHGPLLERRGSLTRPNVSVLF